MENVCVRRRCGARVAILSGMMQLLRYAGLVLGVLVLAVVLMACGEGACGACVHACCVGSDKNDRSRVVCRIIHACAVRGIGLDFLLPAASPRVALLPGAWSPSPLLALEVSALRI